MNLLAALAFFEGWKSPRWWKFSPEPPMVAPCGGECKSLPGEALGLKLCVRGFIVVEKEKPWLLLAGPPVNWLGWLGTAVL